MGGSIVTAAERVAYTVEQRGQAVHRGSDGCRGSGGKRAVVDFIKAVDKQLVRALSADALKLIQVHIGMLDTDNPFVLQQRVLGSE